MSRGMTIADLVQQVYYAIYKVRLDVGYSDDLPEAFHANTDKFQEVVFEANFVLQELQKEQDWNWLREKLILGTTVQSTCGHIQEFQLPEWVYRPCIGFNDAVRLRRPSNDQLLLEIPFTSPRSGNTTPTAMHDEYARINAQDNRIAAFQVGDTITFTRPWTLGEVGKTVETDVIRYLEPLHICDDSCQQPCPLSYESLVFTEITDPYYMVTKTAQRRAEGDPSALDRVMSLTDEASKMLSAMRENDSAKNMPDTYQTSSIGFVSVL